MVTETSESLVPPLPAERRPAIWPWLVMPLVTLLLYYGLSKLHQSSGYFGAEYGNGRGAPADTAPPSP